MRNLLLPLLLSLGIAFAGDLTNSVTVTTGVPGFLSVSYEKVVYREFGFVISYGARTTVNPVFREVVTATPYGIVEYYGQWLNWWIEVSVPNGVSPLVGDDRYWLRTGVQYRW